MAKNHCQFVPAVNGTNTPSNLYMDFLKRVGGDRAFTNLIYAAYLQDGIADAMDKAGYRRDKNGEHKARDVYKFFDVGNMRSEAGIAIDAFAKSEGVMDSSGKLVDFDSATAFQKAQDINSRSKGRVAYVQQHGDKFQVIIETKDSRTQMRAGDVQLQMLRWQALEAAFGKAHVDLTSLQDAFPSLVNPITIDLFLQTVQSIAEVADVKYLSKNDIEMIFYMAQDTSGIKALMNRGWGNVQETVAKAYDVIHNSASYSKDTYNAVANALNQGRAANDAMVTSLKTELKDVVQPSFEAHSKEFDIKNTIDELNEKYGLDSDMMILSDRNIKKLSEAAGHAIVTLNRQLDFLRDNKKGNTKQADDIRKQMGQLAKEIAGKRYYAGLLGFTSKALEYAIKVDQMLKNIPTTGTRMEFAARRAEVLATAKTLQDSYRFIVQALTNLDSLLIDENISDADKATLQKTANDVLKLLNSQEKTMRDLRKDTMVDICTEVFGDNVIEGKAVADIVEYTEADCSIMDFLYSIGRQSNPLLGAMGTVIRDSQLSRDARLADVALRIRRATDKLYKAGHNSEFMYEWVARDDNTGRYYIASSIDWKAYNDARNQYYSDLMRMGKKGFEVQDLMEAWVEQNTEEKTYGGHAERIPKQSIYGKSEDFQEGWTDAQKEYYDTMMDLKGELATLLPDKMQYQFLPPQRRASWVDIIKKGIDGKMTLKEVVKNLLDRMNVVKIREDDTQYGMLLDGEEAISGKGDFSGAVKRQIPIFYLNVLRNQNDLLMDFSAALQSFAHTAINYDEIYRVKDTVDMMSDYILSKTPNARRNGKVQAEVVENSSIKIIAKLKKHAEKFGIESLVEGFIDKHIYGIEMKDTGRGWRMIQALINYTSLNQLAPNLKGAISNYLVGEHQMLIEAVSGSVRKRFGSDVMYSFRDYAAANALMFGSKLNTGVMADHLSNNKNSKAVLLAERFDPVDDLAQELGGDRYYNSMFRQIIGGFNAMGLYSMGEAAIHYVNMYACLLHDKVKDNNGKEVSLYSAFEKTDKQDGNSELKIKDGYTTLDGHTIDDAYLDEIKDRIRYINQNTHGSMNKEDKGIIHQRMAGRAVMNFRQWMVEHYSRRYRGRHWDASTRTFTEGYFNTVGKLIKSYASDYLSFVDDANAHWDELDDAQKQNVWRALGEVTLLACLLCISGALGDPDDHKGEYWYRMAIYQVRRLILDEEASVPPIPFLTGGFVSEGVKVLDSPVASVKTFNGILYPVTGVKDIGKTIENGRFKGWNKYGRNLLKNIPFYNQIDQSLHIGDEAYAFGIFNY